jgi:hypothetical protein
VEKLAPHLVIDDLGDDDPVAGSVTICRPLPDRADGGGVGRPQWGSQKAKNSS